MTSSISHHGVVEIRGSPRAEWASVPSEADRSRLHELNGTRAGERWSPPTIEIVEFDEATGHRLARAELLWLAPEAFAARPRAVEVLQVIAPDDIEFLPVECIEPLHVVNIVSMADVLDENGSTLVRFSTGRILEIERYEFHPEVLGERIFKLPQLPRGPVFATHPIRSKLEHAAVTGVDFHEVWRPTT